MSYNETCVPVAHRELPRPWNQAEHNQPHFLGSHDLCLALWFVCFVYHKQIPKTELRRDGMLLKGRQCTPILKLNFLQLVVPLVPRRCWVPLCFHKNVKYAAAPLGVHCGGPGCLGCWASRLGTEALKHSKIQDQEKAGAPRSHFFSSSRLMSVWIKSKVTWKSVIATRFLCSHVLLPVELHLELQHTVQDEPQIQRARTCGFESQLYCLAGGDLGHGLLRVWLHGLRNENDSDFPGYWERSEVQLHSARCLNQ